ncbi:hypothetical protein AKG12_07200 [Agrobacterium sp. SUL3]|nr:hypothetical protein AKG12_07200 [Agrobacterium sp. SUL3]
MEAPDPGGELGDHIFWQAQTAYDSASKDSASKDSAIYIYVAVAPVHAKLCRAKGNGKFRKSTLGAFEVHLDWRSYFLAAFVRRLRVKCLGGSAILKKTAMGWKPARLLLEGEHRKHPSARVVSPERRWSTGIGPIERLLGSRGYFAFAAP